MRMSRAPVTPDTVRMAFHCEGKVECVTPAGIRLLKTPEELDGMHPDDWIARECRRFGISEPWDLQQELRIGA